MATTVRTAVYLFLWLAVCQVRGSTVPVKMNETIRYLRQHYNFSDEELFGGEPVFIKEKDGSVEDKMLLMGGVLETYHKLFQHMLNQLPKGTTDGNAKKGADSNVREGLKYLQKMVSDLKTSRYQQQHKLLDKLHQIQHIQVDNQGIQNRALWDMGWFFQEAHDLVDKQQRRRRRRQARRFPHPRV